SRRHLRHWERVCRSLDAQPYRSVRYPFPPEPPMTARLFKRMARFGLVRHREDCSWRLARHWQAILRRLWETLPQDDVGSSPETVHPSELAPFVADTNVDTLYISLFAPALPTALVEACGHYKALAQEQDSPIETPWRVFEAPLSMWKTGVGTSETGKGVSWSFLLRNAYVMLRLRKAPLQRLVGSGRRSAPGPWTLGPRAALDGVKAGLAALWDREERGAFASVRWQVSQLHLCADVANFRPEPVDLERFVTRARRKVVHIPPTTHEEAATLLIAGDDLDDYLYRVPDEWADLPPAFFADEMSWDEEDGDGEENNDLEQDSGDKGEE